MNGECREPGCVGSAIEGFHVMAKVGVWIDLENSIFDTIPCVQGLRSGVARRRGSVLADNFSDVL